MSIARDLYQLQEIETALETNEQAQTRINAQLADNQTVSKARVALATAQKTFDELNKQQKQTEWEIDDLTAKIKDLERKLYGGKIGNPKELSNLQAEADDFKKKRSGFEDNSLELMDKIESARQKMMAATTALSQAETQSQNQHQQLTAELEQLKENHTALTSKRQALLPQIAADVLETYTQLRKRKGIAVARVEQGTCLGCRIHLPNADLQQAKSGGMVKCSSCGRILFLA